MVNNLREKFYNFSLKMTTKDREFFSNHSENFKNLQMFVSLGQSAHPDDLGDENYQLYMDENKKVKMKYFVGSKINPNYRKMQISNRDNLDIDTCETWNPDDKRYFCKADDKKSLLARGLSMTEKKPSGPGPGPANKKDMLWVYEPGSDLAPVLQVIEYRE